MAVLGLTKLLAVNMGMRAAGRKPVPSLDTGGTSDHAECERILDEVSRKIQGEGLLENTLTFKSLTLDGSGKCVLPSDTLDARPAGKDHRRHLVVKGDDLYDNENDTDVIGDAAGTVHLTIIKLFSFEDLSPMNKEFIAREAAKECQRRLVGSPEKDVMLGQEAARSETAANKMGPSPSQSRAVNPLADPNAPAVYAQSPFAGSQR